MRFLTTIVLMVAAGMASADTSKVKSVIQNQIAAFGVNDFDRAFQYASPSIQGLFGSPDRFEVMVKEGYPMVWQAEAVQFLDLRVISGRLWQKVAVRDADGVVHLLDYQMVTVDGVWRINAVQKLPQAGAGA
ncbi:DUF4864 domain-containing protein [Shimia sp. SDUM112013]|uniref:DUF4864 domain-containing protein n=1 Tax=Shimia sp. SDUM112013 TaxID=3136160 RepID=UPI0032EB36BA